MRGPDVRRRLGGYETARVTHEATAACSGRLEASSWPDIFNAQTRWLVENRGPQQLAFVLHTGDIVDGDQRIDL